MIILQYHEIFFRLTAPRCPSMAAGAVSLRKSHDIIKLSVCNIVKGQAKYIVTSDPSSQNKKTLPDSDPKQDRAKDLALRKPRLFLLPGWRYAYFNKNYA